MYIVISLELSIRKLNAISSTLQLLNLISVLLHLAMRGFFLMTLRKCFSIPEPSDIFRIDHFDDNFALNIEYGKNFTCSICKFDKLSTFISFLKPVPCLNDKYDLAHFIRV